MTREEIEEAARVLRNLCFSEIWPGVHLMVLKQRGAIKEVCQAMEVWNSISRELKRVRDASEEEQVRCFCAGLYQSSCRRPPLYVCSMVAIMVEYSSGQLVKARAVLILGEEGKEELVSLAGRSIIDEMGEKMKRENPGYQLKTDLCISH